MCFMYCFIIYGMHRQNWCRSAMLTKSTPLASAALAGLLGWIRHNLADYPYYVISSNTRALHILPCIAAYLFLANSAEINKHLAGSFSEVCTCYLQSKGFTESRAGQWLLTTRGSKHTHVYSQVFLFLSHPLYQFQFYFLTKTNSNGPRSDSRWDQSGVDALMKVAFNYM